MTRPPHRIGCYSQRQKEVLKLILTSPVRTCTYQAIPETLLTSPPHFFSIFPRLLLFFQHSSNNLNCSTLREQKQAPGSTDVFGCLSGTHLTLHQDLSGTEKSSQWPQAPVCRELLGFSRLRRNVWPCVPAKLQKLADLI